MWVGAGGTGQSPGSRGQEGARQEGAGEQPLCTEVLGCGGDIPTQGLYRILLLKLMCPGHGPFQAPSPRHSAASGLPLKGTLGRRSHGLRKERSQVPSSSGQWRTPLFTRLQQRLRENLGSRPHPCPCPRVPRELPPWLGCWPCWRGSKGSSYPVTVPGLPGDPKLGFCWEGTLHLQGTRPCPHVCAGGRTLPLSAWPRAVNHADLQPVARREPLGWPRCSDSGLACPRPASWA